MIKRFIIALLLLVLVVGGIVGFNMFRDRAIEQYFANMPVAPVPVSTVTVEPRKWTPGIEAIGTVAAARGVDLTVETTGIVKDILFDSNERVKQGQLLVQLDDAVQRADLEAARTQAGLDKQALARAIELQQKGVGTSAALDAARAAAESSEAQVTKLQAVLDQKQLRAPYKGTLGIPRIELGQFVQPGAVVATLQDLDTMRADFSVPEQRLAELKIGQPVDFGLTEDEMEFKGSITGIEPKVDPSSRLVSVRAEIANPEGRLSPGQFVRVRVVLPEESDVLAVPETALVTSLYGDFVFVVRPATAETPAAQPGADASGQKAEAPKLAVAQVFVKAGRRGEGLVEIAEGIKPGDQIVTAGQNRLSNNTPVIVDNSVTPEAAASEAAAQ